MKTKTTTVSASFTACFAAILVGLTLVPATAEAAKNDAQTEANHEPPNKKLRNKSERTPETKVELTDAGKALADKYAAMLGGLQAEIEKQLPQIEVAKQKACVDTLAAQKLASVQYDIAHMQWRRGCQSQGSGLQSAQEKLEEGAARLAAAEMVMKNALAMPDGHEDKARAVEEAEKILEKRKADLDKLPEAVAKAKEAIETAKQREPELTAQLNAAAKVLEEAKTQSRQTLAALAVDDLLASDALDAKLARAVVISEATPYWLAAYAQQGPEQEKRIERLLADTPLMLEMLVADGPVWEKYGSAVEIYEGIRKEHPKASAGIFQRLALAVALEHAVPLKLSLPETQGDEPNYVDPVQRYAAYEKAYLDGELDPGFADLSAWSLRMVVDGEEPDEISAWGRQMLRNYRPDLITMPDHAWRYVRSVDTEINYTSTYQKLGWDRPDLQSYQNILANGGICGRRAFFGRFILRAFGIPTTARSQPGHAALVRWTPDGWVPCLGGGWGSSNRAIFERYPTDLDFLASTQAREDKQAFMKVRRAQWIGTALGEDSEFGYHTNMRRREMAKFASKSADEMEVPEFWHTVAMITQNGIVEKLEAEALEAVGEDIGESNESALKEKLTTVEIPATARSITVDAEGTITIPAAACSQPTNNTDVIRFMPSNLGGWQLHYSRSGGAEFFAYTVDAPKAGKYRLTARLVTPAPKQHLFLTVNDAKERTDIPLPYTIGMWGELEPVEIELQQGENVLTFHRGHYFMRGVTIRDFTLIPVK